MPKTILLAEDDPFIIDIYSNHFKKEGFEVDIAVDGQMALEKIQNHIPDILLLDIILPKMDGWKLLKELRSNAATKNVKVFVISNLNQQDHADDIVNLGVTKFFLKVETNPEEITTAIREVLK